MNKMIKISRERKKLIRKITEEISNCEIEDKTYILNMIASKIGVENLYEEGTGVRILFDAIDDNLLQEINIFVSSAIEKTKLDLNSD